MLLVFAETILKTVRHMQNEAERRWVWRNDMKIKEVNDEKILFDNGNTITFDHEQD